MFVPNDDIGLLTKCINGEQASWDIFVKRYSKLVYHAVHHTLKLHSYTHKTEDIEDIHNSIFLSLIENDFRKLRQFEGRRGCSLSSWVRLISVRSTIDFLRSQKVHLSINGDSETAQPIIETLIDDRLSVEKQMEMAETERAFKDAINELSPSDKLFIRLYYEKELPEEEIAGIMHVSINTIYSKKNRIREKIKKILGDKSLFARNQE
jgi:RNA polymerase sigma-70 factor (ECF subfamily)